MTVLAEKVKPKAPPAMEDPEPFTSKQFALLSQTYPDLRMERTKEGEIIIIPPAFSETGRKNFKAERSPDASWVEKCRWDALTAEQQEEQFSPLCPDFIVELRSKTDRLSTLQKKMREYTENGARLGWLIDPKWKRVEVYRPGQDVQVLDNPAFVSADPELPGFTLDLEPIW